MALLKDWVKYTPDGGVYLENPNTGSRSKPYYGKGTTRDIYVYDEYGNPNRPATQGGGPPPPSGPSPEQLQREAEARARARENELRRKAGQRSLAQAQNLEGQAKALLHAINTSFGRSRDQNLRDIDTMLNESIAQLKKGYSDRVVKFFDAASDTSKATADQAETPFENLVRERQEGLSGILAQGAGETDQLRAMVMAARNWRDNTAEGNRAYFDTMRSVDAGITDLQVDTRAGMTSAHRQAESERERIWENYFGRRADAYTQLGNVRQTQGDYYASAEENDVMSGGKLGSSRTAASNAFMNASKEAGKSYTQKGLPGWMKNYGDDLARPVARQENSNLAAAMRFEPIQQAEGATQRRWR